MNKEQFQQTSKQYAPKKGSMKKTVIAFVSGGLMGCFGQVLLEFFQMWLQIDAKQAVSPMIMTVVFLTALLTGLGVYDKLAQICGAGLFIPISGFANSLTSCAMEGRSEGPIYGIGSNMFKLAGSVLTYGIVSAYILGLLRFMLNSWGIML